jgi:MFS superfamily sulfate permease-like transporter
LVTIPDGLACAILAGVNQDHGLYGLMVDDALGGSIGTEQQVIALVTSTVLAGLFQYL